MLIKWQLAVRRAMLLEMIVSAHIGHMMGNKKKGLALRCCCAVCWISERRRVGSRQGGGLVGRTLHSSSPPASHVRTLERATRPGKHTLATLIPASCALGKCKVTSALQSVLWASQVLIVWRTSPQKLSSCGQPKPLGLSLVCGTLLYLTEHLGRV